MSACALCGTPAPPPFRAPQPETAPDLDGRPGEPARSTLSRWVQKCRGCGACAPDLAALPHAISATTSTPAYKALRSRHLRWARLAAGSTAEPEAFLQAAWEADDAGRDGAPLRRLALAAWPATTKPDQLLRLADIARRAGAFTEAATLLDQLPGTGLDETAARIASFQRMRIAAADTGRHLLSSAVRPPARTPHVTHGKRAPGPRGFWTRLFGA